MRKAFIALFFICSHFVGFTQSVTETTKISLLTGSPGTELYSTFGHSALRIQDQLQNMDLVFNYGSFDFNTPNFYLKFTRGQLDYMLSVEAYKNFEASFKYENRSIVEQELDLTDVQKQRLMNLLFENYEPENRFYKYDFFYDNCATRIRDIVVTAFGDDFQYHYPENWLTSGMTFRNLIDLYLTHHHWSDFGIDIGLGLPTDKVARPTDYMFLPDFLSEGFASATITRDGQEIPLVKEKRTLQARVDVEPVAFIITPARLFWTIFVFALLLSYWQLKKGIKLQVFDSIFFSAIGLVGWIVFMLWFFTDHIATKDNLNILWAVPLHFPVFLFWNKLSRQLRMWYIMAFGTINILIIILWSIFPQQYHHAFIPLILVVLLRFYFLYRDIKMNHVGED